MSKGHGAPPGVDARLRAWRAISGVAVIAAGLWIVLALPATPPIGAWIVAALSLISWALAAAFVSGSRLYAVSTAAAAHLAKRSFEVRHSMLSSSSDIIIALDDADGLAILELDRQGRVIKDHIVARANVNAEAREDGVALCEDRPPEPAARGRLELRVDCRHRTFHVVFTERVPTVPDEGPDWSEYQAIRHWLAWWRDAVRGLGSLPSGSLPATLASRASRAELMEMAEAMRTPLPRARALD
jgi:hypothetical protein